MSQKAFVGYLQKNRKKNPKLPFYLLRSEKEMACHRELVNFNISNTVRSKYIPDRNITSLASAHVAH